MVPEDLYYSDEHEWVRLERDVATVGVTDYAQEQLGDIVYVDLPDVDDVLSAGDVAGELESTKSVSELYVPLDGTVVAVNSAVDANPEVVNSDPYGEGWLYKIRVADDDPASSLLSAEQYSGVIEGQ